MKTTSQVAPIFSQIFFTAIFLTLLSGGTSLWLSTRDDLTPQQTRIFDMCSNIWNTGTFTCFGLLGGKLAKDLLQSEDEEN